MGDIVLDRWSGAQSARSSAHSIAIERGAAMHAVTKFARLAVQTSLLCVGAWLAIDRQISPGAMMAASIIMGRALAPVEQVVGQWKRIVAFRSAYRRLEDLFQALPAPAAPTALPTPKGEIEVENAVVWPPTASRPSVKGVSFSLKAGESLAIVGASASGKSSLARALAGVWPLREGVIRIDGAAYSPVGPEQARQAHRLPAAGRRAVRRHRCREHRPPRQGRRGRGDRRGEGGRRP